MTGVQTCALPILHSSPYRQRHGRHHADRCSIKCHWANFRTSCRFFRVNDGRVLEHGRWVVVQCMLGRIHVFRRHAHKGALLVACAWFVSRPKAHYALRYAHHPKTQYEVVIVSMVCHPNQRRQVLWHGYLAGGKVTIALDSGGDRKFCFFLLNLSIEPFIHSMLLYTLCSSYALSWCTTR